MCPALFIAAPASGQGKTTVTAGLARYHRRRGLDVRVFKTGPDYLDPMVLEQAAGQPVASLDLWMTGEQHCRAKLYQAAQTADLLLIEGVMGLFDGNPSGADLAQFFGIPVAIVIDARSMAQTFGAIALGLAGYRQDLDVTGVVANALGSQRHQDLIEAAMPPDVRLLGCLRRAPEMALPERHLGLVAPRDVSDIDARLDRLADAIDAAGLGAVPPPVAFQDGTVEAVPRLLEDMTIAVASDAAFTFIYADNLALLEAMGARCVRFSPLQDTALPACDAVWLPGGYPELYHGQLAANIAMIESLHAFHAGGGRILAECGGMLYLMESLTDVAGNRATMAGLLPGQGFLRERGGCQGMQYAPLPDGEMRGHAHHRTRTEGTLTPIAHGRRPHHPAPGEPIYRHAGITASYLHLYFPSNAQATASLFQRQAVPDGAARPLTPAQA